MSKTKILSIDERIAQFGDSTKELLTDIHSKKKDVKKSAAKRGRKPKTVSIPDPDINLVDEGPSSIDSKEARMA